MFYDRNYRIGSMSDMSEIISEIGFLPFFENSVPGFSVEELISPELWFTGIEGPWEWKGPLIRENGFAYGKFFEKKACFVSREWFYDLSNYRRDGYDFDSRYDDGLASLKDRELFELIEKSAPVISKELKKAGNYVKGGKKGFDTIITRLQSQCYVLISDFVYMTDRYMRKYGWGVAVYSTPEKFFGSDFSNNVYMRSPKESYQRLFEHFSDLFPDIEGKTIKNFLK